MESAKISNAKLLEAIVNAIHEGVVIQDLQSNIIAFNQQACKMLNLSASQLLGKSSYTPHWRIIKENGQAFEGREHPSEVVTHTGVPQKDVVMGVYITEDDIRWISVSSNKINLEKEELVFTTFVDITKLMESKKELERIRHSVEVLVKASADLTLDVSDKGYVYKLYHGDQRVLFMPPEYTENRYLQEVFPGEFGLKVCDLITLAIQTKEVQYITYQNPFNPEDLRWFKASISPYKDHQQRVSIAISDITKQKTLELEKEELDTQMFHAFEYSPIGMAFLSTDGHFFKVNPALCALLGYTKAELLSLSVKSISVEDEYERDFPNTRLLLSGELSSYQTEKRYLHKQGHYIWGRLAVSVVKPSEKREAYFIVQIMDITEHRQLINRLEEQKTTIEKTAHELESKVEQLEDFNRIVAHNLRGPATNIHVVSKMIRQETETKERNELIDLLEEASMNLVGTLQSLMDVLSIRLNTDISLEDCSFAQSLEGIKKSLFQEIAQVKVDFETSFLVETIPYPRVYLDSMLYNLISNAIKYRQADVPLIIKISTYQKEGKTCLEVSDNGLGIDLKKYAKSIFQYSKRFHKSIEGKGVGLFITKNQINSLGGSIQVESEPMKGATFTITF
ncbi:PAS domain S-box protein [Cytophagales bacterium LB-30]|uniref:histidine kinase n=1 Tax=Shiella aurantiaca TaxID=3058365 RepID=A0ABT8F818_9BACT|nr:PAS domain S-box protein [Shiella aurantiaca]MDN4166086.1 PAS domain S-box protein [Shiella aurantiaca]